jgi:hypothetical protein
VVYIIQKSGLPKKAALICYLGKDIMLAAFIAFCVCPSTSVRVSKNVRSMFSNPVKIFGTRNLSMIMVSPSPIALNIFILVNLKRDLKAAEIPLLTLIRLPLSSLPAMIAFREQKRFLYFK